MVSLTEASIPEARVRVSSKGRVEVRLRVRVVSLTEALVAPGHVCNSDGHGWEEAPVRVRIRFRVSVRVRFRVRFSVSVRFRPCFQLRQP